MKRYKRIWIEGVLREFWMIATRTKQRVYEIESNEKKVSAQMVEVKPPLSTIVRREIERRQ